MPRTVEFRIIIIFLNKEHNMLPSEFMKKETVWDAPKVSVGGWQPWTLTLCTPAAKQSKNRQ